MKYHLGQNSSEYALVIGLVVIVAIGALSVLGEQTSGLLGNTIGKKKGPAPVRFALAGSPLVNEPDVVIEGANGQKIVISGYPTTNQAFAELVDQSGSNGSEILAQLLNQLASIKDPTIVSKEEQDFLKNLANASFTLSRTQTLQNENLRTTGIADSSKDGDISPIDLLTFINNINTISRLFSQTTNDGVHYNNIVIDSKTFQVSIQSQKRDQEETNEKPLFQFKNPQVRALVNDAIHKIMMSGAGSMKLTLDEVERANDSSRGTVPSKTLTSEEIQEKYAQLKLNLLETLSKSTQGSKTICNNSETGVSDLNKLACIKKG